MFEFDTLSLEIAEQSFNGSAANVQFLRKTLLGEIRVREWRRYDVLVLKVLSIVNHIVTVQHTHTHNAHASSEVRYPFFHPVAIVSTSIIITPSTRSTMVTINMTML